MFAEIIKQVGRVYENAAIFDLRRAETVSKSSPGDIRLSTAAPGRAAGKNEV
jgi:hypothetical protein